MVVLEKVKHSMINSKHTEQNQNELSHTNHDNPILKLARVFILCERCYWCATYFDINRLLKEEEVDDDNNRVCPRCDAIDSLSNLPIAANESFNFNYTVRRGIVLQFREANNT
jgi:hypothetical protein